MQFAFRRKIYLAVPRRPWATWNPQRRLRLPLPPARYYSSFTQQTPTGERDRAAVGVSFLFSKLEES